MKQGRYGKTMLLRIEVNWMNLSKETRNSVISKTRHLVSTPVFYRRVLVSNTAPKYGPPGLYFQEGTYPQETVLTCPSGSAGKPRTVLNAVFLTCCYSSVEEGSRLNVDFGKTFFLDSIVPAVESKLAVTWARL